MVEAVWKFINKNSPTDRKVNEELGIKRLNKLLFRVA